MRDDSQESEKEVEKNAEASLPTVSGSRRKLAAALSGIEVDNSTDSEGGSDVESTTSFELNEPSGVILQDVDILNNAAKSLSCKCCGGELKLEDRKAKKGLSRMMLIVCSSCEFVCKLPGNKEVKSGKTTFAELNRKSAMAGTRESWPCTFLWLHEHNI